MQRDKNTKEIEVRKGAPPPRNENRVIWIFGFASVILIIIILNFQDGVESYNVLVGGGSTVWSLVPSGAIIGALVAATQVIIMRQNISRTKLSSFVLHAGLGGALGGLIAGVLVGSNQASNGLVLGGVLGIFAGGISSAIQNRLLRDKTMASRWFGFSALSWGFCWAIGYQLSWSIPNIAGTAVGAGFILLLSGFSLWQFLLRNPGIEF